MGLLQDVIRRLTVRGTTEGMDKVEADLLKVAGAQRDVAVASNTTERATISLERRLESLSRSLDGEYRAQVQLAKINKDLDAARAQGLITAKRQTELSTLAAAKYRVEGEAAVKAAEGLRLLKEVSLGFVSGIGAGVLLGGLTELPTAVADAVDRLGKTGNIAQTIGITTKALQELRYAAQLSDVDVGTLDEAMQKFSTNLAKNGGPLQKTFAAQNLRISGDVFTDLKTYADLIANASNQEQRNKLVTDAFGKSAQEMGRLFEDGSRGIDRLAQAAEHAGAVISADKIQRAKELNDQMTALKPQLEAAQMEFALLVVPGEIVLLQTFNQGIRETRDLLTDIVNLNVGGLFQKLGHLGLAVSAGPAGFMAQMQGDAVQDAAIAAIKVNGGGATGSAYKSGWGAKALNPFGGVSGTASGGVKTSGSGGGGESEAAARARAIRQVTDSLKQQTAALYETNRQAYVDQQLSQAKVSSADAEGKAIASLAASYYDQKHAIEANNEAMQFFAQTGESALEGLIDGSKSFTDSLVDMAKGIEQAVLQASLLGSGPLAGLFGTKSDASGGVGGIFGSLLSGIFGGSGGGLHAGYNLNAKGNVFESAGLSAYSNQIVTRPTIFPFARGSMGLMGEAGPEAILPLMRAADGSMGVRAAANNNNGPIKVSLTIVRQGGSGEDTATATQSDDELHIEAVLYDRVAKGVSTPGNPVNRSLRVAMGTRQQLTRRGS